MSGNVGYRYPKGNQFWKARSRHGRKKAYETPELLAEACEDYFQWIVDNPLMEPRAFPYEGDVSIEYIPKMRAMTLRGLCVFLGLTIETWHQYRKHPDYSEVCKEVDYLIYEQKLTGAAAGFLNASIIAREIGLKDQSEIDHKSTDGTMTPNNPTLSKEEAADLLALLADKK